MTRSRRQFFKRLQSPYEPKTVLEFGSGGSTDLSANEVIAGGGYTAGGNAVSNPTLSLTAAKTTLDDDGANLLWTSSASGDPADIRCAIVYSETATFKDCIGFIDMTSDGTTAISLLTAPIGIDWNALGILAETVNV